jgi:hypothetical protein
MYVIFCEKIYDVFHDYDDGLVWANVDRSKDPFELGTHNQAWIDSQTAISGHQSSGSNSSAKQQESEIGSGGRSESSRSRH